MPLPATRVVELPRPEKPLSVWTLMHETDPEKKPDPPAFLQHGRTAFLEDEIHDWTFHKRGGKPTLRYASRLTDEGVWILLEYAAAP